MPVAKLGPFDLHELAARGGMAVVWRGEHCETRTPVAVKVLAAESARNDAYRAFFRNELRITAALDHPRIVRVFDHGDLPEGLERIDASLAPASPYLVMEWAGGGTLRLAPSDDAWLELRSMMHRLLDALAHAHARDIVHRDLKPSNVLLTRDEDGGAAGLKLADFGIARPLGSIADDEDDEIGVTGTPAYMAPEQWSADWRELGPWTDLYALGCLAYRLASGRVPFPPRGNDVRDLVRAHLERTVPPLVPRFPVPSGFEAWLLRLLAKDPERRTHHAADAAAELLELGAATASTRSEFGANARQTPDLEPASDSAIGDVTTVHPVASEASFEETVVSAPRVTEPAAGLHAARERTRSELRPLPASGLENDAAAPSAFRAVGLVMQALRPTRLAGRVAERTALWESLGAVHASGRARLVVLRGATGTGKSRLADWLAVHANELGAATPLRVHHGAVRGPGHGVAAALARHFRVQGLAASGVAEHLAHRVEFESATIDEIEAIADLLAAPTANESTAIRKRRFSTAGEMLGVLRGALRAVATERPVVLVVDDGAWADDTLEFVQHVLDAQSFDPVRVLVVVAAGDEGLASRPIEANALTVFRARPDTVDLALGPLGREPMRELLDGGLGLAPSLVEALEARIEGNPLFAIQLVRDWVAQGSLHTAIDGYRLRDGAALEIATDLASVWRARIARVLAPFDETSQIAIEVAACLGQWIDTHEWRRACALAGAAVSDALVEVLLRERLVETDERGPAVGWWFSHAMLRESIESRAVEAGRIPALERACAEMLRDRLDADSLLRRGRHLVAAGDAEGALEPLRRVAALLNENGNFAAAMRVVSEYERAVSQAELEPEDPRRVAGLMVNAHILGRRGRIAEAHTIAASIENEARTHGWESLRTEAMLLLGWMNRSAGRHAEAIAFERDVEARALAAGDDAMVAEARRSLGDSHLVMGAAREAIPYLERARSYYVASQRPYDIARCDNSLANCARYLGHNAESVERMRAALENFTAAGSRWGVAKSLNGLGDSLRFSGDLASAAAMYRDARAQLDAIGSSEARYAEANSAIVAAEEGRWADARATADACRGKLPQHTQAILEACLEAIVLACDAGEGVWARFATDVDTLAAKWIAAKCCDPDMAVLLQLAGRTADAQGHRDHARAAYRCAERVWRELGRAAEADEARRLAEGAQ